jgi:hypothetical protein
MKKVLNDKIVNVNPKNEITKIEYISKDFDIKGIKHKNKDTIENLWR